MNLENWLNIIFDEKETRLKRLWARQRIVHNYNAAQQNVHLTAFGVGTLAFFAGVVISWFVSRRKHGGR